jgi:spore maturation protein CgeB
LGHAVKVFIVGKRGSVTHWAEDAVAGFQAAGHDVRFGGTRNPGLHRSVERILLAGWAGVPRGAHLGRAIGRFAPDLILVVTAYHTPPPILEYLASLPNRPPMLGWVGDRFSSDHHSVAALFDGVAYTDTGLLALHKELGFACQAAFLPHAANPRLHTAAHEAKPRRSDMVFVANPTEYRLSLVSQIRTPLQLYGRGWVHLPGGCHQVHARRIGLEELAAVYRSHLAVLNVRNERNVMVGLNQRHFDPYLAGTPVVADSQQDLPLCFEPGHEVLVYHDVDELNDLYVRLRRERERAAAVGEAGRRRVLAEHTYGHRLTALAKLL